MAVAMVADKVKSLYASQKDMVGSYTQNCSFTGLGDSEKTFKQESSGYISPDLMQFGNGVWLPVLYPPFGSFYHWIHLDHWRKK